jgi:thiamine-monophosphate kinase
LIKRHLSPCPRLFLGQALSRHRWATAAIDVSDGLLIDASHLLEESKVGALIWEDRIPLSRSYRKWVRLHSRDPYRFALSGGEDYELLFTAPAEIRRRLVSLSMSAKVDLTRIGTILPPQKGLRVLRKEGRTYFPSRFGFDHFG